jgi:hypothetical protein
MENWKPTLQELKGVYYLDKEIQSLSTTLFEIKSSSVVGSKSYPNTVTVSNYNRYSKVENKVAAIQSVESALKDKIVELQELYNKILQWIFSVDDSLVRMIYKLRYLELYTWNEVADAVGGNNTEYSVKKMAQRYLKKEGIENDR